MDLTQTREAIARGLTGELVTHTVAPFRPGALRTGHGFLTMLSLEPAALGSYGVKLTCVLILGTDEGTAQFQLNDLAVEVMEAVRTVAIQGEVNVVAVAVNPITILADSTTLFCLELQLLTEVEAT